MRKNFQTKYNKIHKSEEAEEKKKMNDAIGDKKRAVREEFLNTFFLPARKHFEDNMAEYQKLWPIKAEDMEEEPIEHEIIHTFGATVSEVKVNP